MSTAGGTACVSTTEEVVETLEVGGMEIPLISTRFGEVVDLPDPVAGTLYVVSALVAAASRRDDVVSPGRLIRDDQGRVMGAAALVVQSGSA